MFISDRRIFVTADRTRIVDESDPEATFLLVAKGGSLDDATAAQYGLTELPSAKLALSASGSSLPEADGASSDEMKAENLAENKAVEPGENKQIFPAANPRAKRVVKRDHR